MRVMSVERYTTRIWKTLGNPRLARAFHGSCAVVFMALAFNDVEQADRHLSLAVVSLFAMATVDDEDHGGRT